ncbi:carbohydrate esterase [Cladorrhinum samala]|uniref:Carbohydrate esterase n=1 Tax=Cladorrhinum samala TaxID=585594 RepID=A0AAV9HUP0_9PEZI|nr:carbohydrate esterase [Cladorrhinum samala]
MLIPLRRPSSAAAGPLKILVVGDSISHGREGDWTWRYRLWEWLRCQPDVPFKFVGSYRGTVPPDSPRPPTPPRLVDEPEPPPRPLRTDGGYAKPVCPEFLEDGGCNHFSAFGRQIYQAKSLVAGEVSLWQPDLCLVEMGFNDLAWLGSSASDVLGFMRELIEQARAAKPDLMFAVADVPHRRTDSPGQEDELSLRTDMYNAALARAVLDWDAPGSPVKLVRFCENYWCGGADSRAAYDGLHPNALGEYQIAQAFVRTLVRDFGIGKGDLEIPSDRMIPERVVSVPGGVEARSAPCGAEVEWEKVYGAYGYELDRIGRGEVRYSACNKFWQTDCEPGEVLRYRVRSVYGDSVRSEWSDAVEAVARPETAPPPGNIKLWPANTGFQIAFSKPEGKFVGEIERYSVVVYDHCLPGSFPRAFGIKDRIALVTGLEVGHRYGVWVRAWNKAGEGLPNGCDREVVPGLTGVISAPRGFRIEVLENGGADLMWPVDYSVGGYEVWALNTTERKQECLFKCPVDGFECGKRTVRWLTPSLRTWKFAIKAYNGSVESDLSEWLSVPENGSSLGPSSPLLIDDSINLSISQRYC